MRRRTFLGGSALGIAAAVLPRASEAASPPAMAAPWDAVFARMPAALAAIAQDPAREVRLHWTTVERDADGVPRFHARDFGGAPRRWFPAASVAKLPMALLMAEAVQAAGGDPDTVLALEAPPATGEWDDEPLAEPFSRGLDRTFAVSENRPFNRWYELLGGDHVHARLAALGYPHARLIARLGSPDPVANRRTGGGTLLGADGRVLARCAPATAEARRFPFGPALRGAGWQGDDGVVVPGPHDFSHANYLPLADSLRMLQAFVAPDTVPPVQRWRIDGPLRARLLRALALRPRDSRDPVYPEAAYPDGHARWFLVGDGTQRYPEGVTVFGKSGMAYGSLSEVAWVVDRDAGVECLLAASVQCNADGIYNDDRYDYDDVGLPFLAAWSRAVLACERAARAGTGGLPR